MAWNDTKYNGVKDYPRDAQEACAPPRKATAAEYTEKRIAEAANVLSNEVDRLEGQYNRLRTHFGIPPEPTACDPKGTAMDSGMEGQINRLMAQLSGLTGLVTKMNELI